MENIEKSYGDIHKKIVNTIKEREIVEKE